jgi:hypothetical protein
VSLCDPDDLRTALGSATVDTDLAAVQESCDAATSYVMAVLGADTIVLPYPPAIRRAAMVCAVRIYQDPKSPFGVIGGPSEVPMYSKGAFPDVDAMLLGWRLRFGLA